MLGSVTVLQDLIGLRDCVFGSFMAYDEVFKASQGNLCGGSWEFVHKYGLYLGSGLGFKDKSGNVTYEPYN